ncbi:MAG: bifunctional diaminohydroxyphosphoribosylaminopyrimidine deaminase/5-amino-6-(5-phosphoribosylamino)uracil reductase RibD [Candidatus Gracilibacteria bacterium]|jgi:diaminohydroxyphosphoribosylaminopyrimidine deaminase/5-amino-6-(5-phosphoribosylamino)uracil reductase
MQERFLKRALELAQKGEGLTSPNPCVGAVIVKNGKIIGEGWHKKAGTDHAEVVAIKSVKTKKALIGAEIYVTLEPCNHYGKTPPCTKAIIKSGIKKVFIGIKDPIHKGGILELKKHEIVSEVLPNNSKLSKEIRFLDRFFLKFATTGLPYVIMKAGISLDGKIAAHRGKKGWITSKKARMDAKKERTKCDAVLVGSGTVKIDNPKLAGPRMRVIIDKKLELPLSKKVFRDKNVFVATTDLASPKDKLRFQKAQIPFKSFGKTRVNIPLLLKHLAKLQIQSLFIEGGAKVFTSFHNHCDELLLYIAPKVIGTKDSVSMFGTQGLNPLSNLKKDEYIDTGYVDGDVKIRFKCSVDRFLLDSRLININSNIKYGY